MKKAVPIGLAGLHYAKLIDDPATGGLATYEAPISVPGIITANVNPNSSVATLFADNGPYDTATTIGEITLELNLADIPMDVQADWFGHQIVGGIMQRKATDVPPFVAVGYKTLLSDGSWRYTWLNKGKFALHEQNNQTRGDAIEYQTPTITGSFLKRDCDDEWQRSIDENYIDYAPSIGANWFNSPYGGTPDLTAPTVTVTPADGATGVAANASAVFTFNKAIALSSVNAANFGIINMTNDTAVAGNLSVNASRTVVTFTPSSNLPAASQFMAYVTTGAKSVYGVALENPVFNQFSRS